MKRFRPVIDPKRGKEIALRRANELKEATIKFTSAIEYIVDKLQMPNASLGIFNINSANIIYDAKGHMASVAYTPRNGFVFTINATRFATASVEDIAFVLLHETMHYILNHLTLYDMHVEFDNPDVYNIATDLIINDIIINVVNGLNLLQEFKDNVSLQPLYGPEILGFDCSKMKLLDVYREVLKQPFDEDKQKELANNTSNQWLLFPVDSKDKDKFDKDLEDIKHMFDKNPAPSRRPSTSGQSGAGNSEIFNDEITTFIDTTRHAKLLAKLFPFKSLRTTDDTVGHYTWQRRPKSHISLPDSCGVYPLYKQITEFKPNIIHAIDVSGSVTNDQLKLFFDLYNIMPRFLWKIDTYVFNTQVQKIVLDTVGGWAKIPTGGGTRFNAVAELANSLKQYPDGILIVTDGQCGINKNLIPETHRNKWVWIIDCDNDHELEDYKNSIGFGKFFRAKDIEKLAK